MPYFGSAMTVNISLQLHNWVSRKTFLIVLCLMKRHPHNQWKLRWTITIPRKTLVIFYIMTVQNIIYVIWMHLYTLPNLWSSFWNTLYLPTARSRGQCFTAAPRKQGFSCCKWVNMGAVPIQVRKNLGMLCVTLYSCHVAICANIEERLMDNCQ
jgi:hypothetical protein